MSEEQEYQSWPISAIWGDGDDSGDDLELLQSLKDDVRQLKDDVDELQNCGIHQHDDGDLFIIENDIVELQGDATVLQGDVVELQENLNCCLRGCQYECGLDNVVNVILQEQKRLSAAVRVLYQLISYDKNFRNALMDHLFGKKVTRKALIDTANNAESHQRGKDNYYANFEAAVLREIKEMEDEKNER